MQLFLKRLRPQHRTLAGGLSSAASALEGHHAWAWARSIWADTLAAPAA